MKCLPDPYRDMENEIDGCIDILTATSPSCAQVELQQAWRPDQDLFPGTYTEADPGKVQRLLEAYLEEKKNQALERGPLALERGPFIKPRRDTAGPPISAPIRTQTVPAPLQAPTFRPQLRPPVANGGRLPRGEPLRPPPPPPPPPLRQNRPPQPPAISMVGAGGGRKAP